MKKKDVNSELISETDKLNSTLEKLVALLKHKDSQINEKDLEIGALNSIIQSLITENKKKDIIIKQNQIRINALQQKINILKVENLKLNPSADHESNDEFDNDRKGNEGI